MTVYVESRPFPGHEPLPPHDPTEAAAQAMAAARRQLAEPLPCPPECRICHNGWETFDHAIGTCAVCGEPCRSIDEEGRQRHPTCEAKA